MCLSANAFVSRSDGDVTQLHRGQSREMVPPWVELRSACYRHGGAVVVKTNGPSDFDTHHTLTNGSRLVLDVKSELNGSRKGQHMANYYFNGSRFGQNLRFCPVKSTFWTQN